MRTISSFVDEWLEQKPFIVHHMQQGLLNNSALARTIQCDIEAEIGEKVSREALAMAISRYTNKLPDYETDRASKYVGDITLQTGLSVVNFNADDFYKAVEPAVTELNSMDEFFVLTQGLRHAGLITKTLVLKSLPIESEQVIYVAHDLVGITIRLRSGHKPVLGVCAYIVSLVSQNGVNLEEVISTKDEMTLVIDEKYAQRASDVLMRASQNA